MAPAQRYTSVAIALHWAIAAAILANILIGWWMHEAIEAPATQARAIGAYQLHKSIGLSVLGLSFVRLGWRLTHPIPALPAAMPAWEKLLARAVQWAFYAMMIALPLAGWIYVSAGWSAHDDRPLNVPTLYFGLFRVPHLFGLEHAAVAVRRSVAGAAIETHEALAWATLGLLALHVAGALKHHFHDRDGVLAQMLPGVDAPAPDTAPRAQRVSITIMAAVAVLILGVSVLLRFEAPPAPPQSPPFAPSVIERVRPHGPSDGTVELHEPADAPQANAAKAGAASATAATAPQAWRIVPGASEIAFSGVHAGVPFRGRFTRWSADIRFDPEQLDASHATVTIETASASDGVALHDQSLPQAEWLDTAHFPNATFRTISIRRDGAAFTASSALTIKGKMILISLPFTLAISGDRARMDGRARISREAANLGMDSDPDAEYVSREIVVDVHVEATRAP
jgi:cytochrome b561